MRLDRRDDQDRPRRPQTLFPRHSEGQAMTQRKTLQGGVIPHDLTEEERRKGAETTNRILRERREAAERLIVERLADKIDPITKRHVEIATSSRSDAAAMTGIALAYDRVAGKATQPVEHTGKDGGPIVTEHREKLTLRSGLEQIQARRGQPVDVSSN
jgi:hypothetical protein